jgi:flavin-binding protein dodecin
MGMVDVVELVSESEISWEDAVKAAVTEAARGMHGITDVEVVQLTAAVEGDRITSYRAKVKVSHLVEAHVLSGLRR